MGDYRYEQVGAVKVKYKGRGSEHHEQGSWGDRTASSLGRGASCLLGSGLCLGDKADCFNVARFASRMIFPPGENRLGREKG